jgi:hypothetical protein
MNHTIATAGDKLVPVAETTDLTTSQPLGDGPEASSDVATPGTQRGMVSAEWAVGIIAAIAIAGVLLAVVTSGPVQDAVLKFILSVINLFSGGFGKIR